MKILGGDAAGYEALKDSGWLTRVQQCQYCKLAIFLDNNLGRWIEVKAVDGMHRFICPVRGDAHQPDLDKAKVAEARIVEVRRRELDRGLPYVAPGLEGDR